MHVSRKRRKILGNLAVQQEQFHEGQWERCDEGAQEDGITVTRHQLLIVF